MEPWLRGPVPHVSPYLQPAAHALMHCAEQIPEAVLGSRALSREALWQRPGGAASVGFHLRHVAGSIDRLLTYARGEQLSEAQLAFLKIEGDGTVGDDDAASLVAAAVGAIDRGIEVIRATPESELLQPREVGRARLPSNVLGLLFHIAEHTHRHTGQIATTMLLVTQGSHG